MAYKILKQFDAQSATVWVEMLDGSDTIDVYDTQELAEAKKTELEAADNTRLYKIIEE
jgi:hypothetical protein|tara:strand:- start:1206 stop:1379 length:174 start_codon:yes stop_codon:yes gene_type:complete